MCGITGYQGSKPQFLIDSMLNAISHRGPDNLSYVFLGDGNTALGHTRLSILDLSVDSNQPIWNDKNTHCISFNGEIYNYKSLREELIGKGYCFKSAGDAEVLLNLFIEYNTEALNMLNGIFAFAIWNSEKEELFIARDQLGVKPLYYAETVSGFVFSSELKSLLCDRSISREIDRTAISHYLRYLWCPSPMTPLKAVKKLPPGHFIVIKNGCIQAIRQFYRLPSYQGSDWSREYSEQVLLKALESSVERQLVADVNIGAFLSGGLDSSAIVAMAAKKLGGKNLPCYTIKFEGASAEGMQDDLPYAQIVAKHLGVPLEIVRITPDIINDLPRLIYQLDEPQADLAPLNAWYIARLARKQGVKVLLSGAGGDDLLTGYRRHYALQQERYWSWMPKTLRLLLQTGTAILPKDKPMLRRIAKAFKYAALNDNDRLPTYFHWLETDIINGLFKKPLTNIQDPLINYMRSLPDDMSPLDKMLQLDIKFFLVDHNFNYTDKVSMAEGVEVRVPLVDLEMVEITSQIPNKFKQRGVHGKWIFKKSMERYLPYDVIYRPKTGFGAPVRPWIRNELREIVDELLSESAMKSRNLFDHRKIRQLIERDRKGELDAAYTILSLMSIELWLRQFIDNPVPSVGYN